MNRTRNDLSRRPQPLTRRGLLVRGAAAAAAIPVAVQAFDARAEGTMSDTIQANKAIVGRWFIEFWGNPWNPKVIDDLAAPDMLLQYSLHAPRKGRDDVRAFITGFRAAFPDLGFAGAADLIAEGDYVVGRWVGGGTHTGPAFSDFLLGSLPAASGRTMRFTGTTVVKVVNGRITEEIGLDDGVTALTQLGLLRRP
jgi:predicted ester cyclase